MIWRFRPPAIHFPHLVSKQKDKSQKTNPDMVPYSHYPPGHNCGLPCCSEDLQIQLRIRRQPRSCIGIQENDVIQQNFTFKGRLKKIPSLDNGFYSVQQPKEVKHGDIPKFGSVSRLSTIPEEQRKNYNFLKGRGITLPESNTPDITEKVYLQGFSTGESDDILDFDSESELDYYITVKAPTEPDRGVPYTQQDLDQTRIYPWDLLKEIRDKAKTGDKSDDSASSNYYEVLQYPEEESVQNKTSQSTVLPECKSHKPKPPDVPPKLPKQNIFNHPPLPKDKDKIKQTIEEKLKEKLYEKPDERIDDKTKDKNETNDKPVDQNLSRFPHLEQANNAPKYNTYNSVHTINNMANKSSKAAYDKYVSVSRSSQIAKPFHRDSRDIDFTGSDNPRHGRMPKYTNKLDQILQKNYNSTDHLEKDCDSEHFDQNKTFNNDKPYGKSDKTLLIQENCVEEDEEGITNEGFKNIRIDGKILGSRNAIVRYGTAEEKVYHGSLKHGEIDGQMLSDVIKAAGFSETGLKYFHVDDIDSYKVSSELNKTTLADSPITLIL